MANRSLVPIRAPSTSRYARASSASPASVEPVPRIWGKRSAEIDLEILEQALPGFGRGLEQSLHVRERVEEKVRFDLRFHELKSRLGHLLLEVLARHLGLVHRSRRRFRTAAKHVDERDGTSDGGKTQRVPDEVQGGERRAVRIQEFEGQPIPKRGTEWQSDADDNRATQPVAYDRAFGKCESPQHCQPSRGSFGEKESPALDDVLDRPLIEHVGLRQDLRREDETKQDDRADAAPGQSLPCPLQDPSDPVKRRGSEVARDCADRVHDVPPREGSDPL